MVVLRLWFAVLVLVVGGLLGFGAAYFLGFVLLALMCLRAGAFGWMVSCWWFLLVCFGFMFRFSLGLLAGGFVVGL